MVAPASRFSNTADTGIRVSRNTHAPLSLPGTLSTAGHWDQSRVAMFFTLPFLSTTVRRRRHALDDGARAWASSARLSASGFRWRGLLRLLNGCFLGLLSRHRQVFHFGRAPHVPTGDAAVWTPALAVGQQLFRLGQLGEFVHLGEAFADAIVVHGQHIRTSQAKDQQHLDRPAADAAHAVETLDQ